MGAFALAAACVPAEACTAFTLARPDGLVIGRNSDLLNFPTGLIFTNHRHQIKTAFALAGRESTSNLLTWRSRFGSVTFCSGCREAISGGMNEAGLVVNSLTLEGTTYPGEDTRPVLSIMQYAQYLLDTCQSVDDVVASDTVMRVRGDIVGQTRAHLHVADRDGRTLIIEFLNGRATFHVGAVVPVSTLTNDPYQESVTHWRSGAAHGAIDESSPARFVRATTLAASAVAGIEPLPEAAMAILGAVQQGPAGSYTAAKLVFDIPNLRIYFRTWLNSSQRWIDLNQLDFAAGAPARMLSYEEGGAGDVTALFHSFDWVANQEQMRRRLQYDRFTNYTAAELAGIARYPETFVANTDPESRAATPGSSWTLQTRLTGAAAATLGWEKDGAPIAAAAASALSLPGLQPSDAGLYSVNVRVGRCVSTSESAIVALLSTTKTLGAAREVGPNILHPSGRIYDQVLLDGTAAAITADHVAGEVTRLSFLDENDDIVQVEFAGPGTLTLSLESPSGPAAPTSYNQTVVYMKGRARIVVAGATGETNLSVFSVGRANAVNQALFRDDVDYDGTANIASIAILSADGQFGGLRTANARYSAERGLTGVYAPHVRFLGPVYVGNIEARETATPVLILGAADLVTQINGGNLSQSNGRAVRVSGLSRLDFVAGSTSQGQLLTAQVNQGRLEEEEVDVTRALVH